MRLRAGEKLWLSNAAIEAEAIRIQETRSLKHPWQAIVVDYFEMYPEITKTTVKDLYVDAIDGNFSRMTFGNKALILNILRVLKWKRNASGYYVNPKIEKEMNDILGG